MYSGHKESRECLLTLVERKTRLEVILKLPNRAAVAVRQAFDQLERQLGGELFRTMFRSITLDMGDIYDTNVYPPYFLFCHA